MFFTADQWKVVIPYNVSIYNHYTIFQNNDEICECRIVETIQGLNMVIQGLLVINGI